MGEQGAEGGAAAALPWFFPWLPAGGLAEGGGCWGLQQAQGVAVGSPAPTPQG